MADKEAPDGNNYLSCVIRIQALLRGALVRKQIEDVKKSFEDLFEELERNDTRHVEWESLLCVPKVGKKSSQKQAKKVKSSATRKQNKDLTVQKENCLFPVKDDSSTDADKPFSDDRNSPRFNSVEVQTSFIDIIGKSDDEKQKLNESSEHGSCRDDRVLDDLDTSWKDRVVPFIQNNFDEYETENRHNKVDDFHLDLNTDRESYDGHSSKSECSARRSSKDSSRDVDLNLHHCAPRSVKSSNDKRKGSLEHSNEEITQSRAANRPVRPEHPSRFNASSRRHVNVEVYDDPECQYSNISENGSSRSRSGQRHQIERSNYCDDRDEGLKIHKTIENDRRIENNSTSDKSAQFRFVPVSNRSQKSVRSDINSELDSPEVHSSRSRTSNRSEKSDCSKAHSDKADGESTSRSRNIDDKYVNGSSKHNGNATNRSDRSAGHRQHSDRSDRSAGRTQHSDRSDCLVEHRQHSDRSDRSAERTQRSDRSDRLAEHEQYSDRSYKSAERGQLSDRSGGRSRASSTSSHKSDGHKSYKSCAEKTVEVLHPPRSSVSPVAFHSASPDNKHHIQDSTTLTNVTSVWDSFNSMPGSQSAPMSGPLPEDATSLKELRKNISMELLWVQQAIDSRKNYLKLKGKM